MKRKPILMGLLGIFFSAKVAAAFPNDPDFENMWMLFSYLPADHHGEISEQERLLGSGISADLAWQIHKGNADMLIAILDSGIYWHERDLLERMYLNKKELPLPLNAVSYDANADGRFSISDYAADLRVKDPNSNGVLDPEDLILTFSDGSDADGNGFVDDICGWDFLESDNNPGDRVKFGHGTGEAKDSVASLNNGIGGTGVCGNCSFVPVRVDDSFVVDANAFSAGVMYATNNGVKLIQQAVGSLNWGPTTQAAINYAYDHNVVIIGTAADENSYHHNYPSVLDPVVYTNAVRYDRIKYQDSNTFLNFNNCSNLGARVDIATPALACSSEATGVLSGAVGLAVSYAQSIGRPINVGELIGLIKSSATDINLGASQPGDYRYSSFAGWDSLSGYGRTNVYAMVKNIQAQQIPPEARIVSPSWFEIFRTGQDQKISVAVKASSSKSTDLNLKLEVAKGVDTTDAQFTVIKEANVGIESFTGEFANFSIQDVGGLAGNGVDGVEYQFAYTFRFSVQDKASGLKSEARRTVFIFDDARLYKTFPRRLKGSGESAGVFADLNGDGAEEYITADGAGFVHAFTHGGEGELAGFPVAAVDSRFDFSNVAGMPKMHAAIIAPVAVSELAPNQGSVIVYVTLEGQVGVIQKDGQQKAGFPAQLPKANFAEVAKEQTLSNGVLASPVIVDLNQDGKKEIVVVDFNGYVHVYTETGDVFAGFPVAISIENRRAKLVSSPAIIDINEDGIWDLVLGSNHVGKSAGYIFAIDGRGKSAPDGAYLKGFPARIPLLLDQALPLVGMGIPTSPLVADLDKDGKEEIIVHPFAGKTYIIAKSGNVINSLSTTIPAQSGINDTHMLSGFSSPSVGDLNGDGFLDPITGGVGKKILTSIALGGKRIPFNHTVSAWDGKTAKMFGELPMAMDTMILGPSTITLDLDGDSREELIASSSGFYLRTFGLGKGREFEAPFFTGGWIFATPSVGDFDGDGLLELATTTREGYLFIWRTAASVKNRMTWPTYKGSGERLGKIWMKEQN